MTPELNIVADANMTEVAELFGDLGRVRLVDGRSLRAEDLHLADVLLVRSVTRVDEALLSHSGVGFVGSATSGIDHIDTDYLDRAEVSFAYAPGSNANSVVEYVLTAIAAQADHLERLLHGGEVGIVGFGHIGRLLGRRLSALGVAWQATDPWLGDPELVSLERVLQCQVICLHAELTDRLPYPSRYLLAADQLAGLHSGQLLINAGRGALIQGAHLLARLQRDDAPRVVLDVWENEPDIHLPLLESVNLGTAHIAGYSYDGKREATAMLSRALRAKLGLPIAHDRGKPVELPAAQARTVSPPDFLRGLLCAAYDVRGDDSRLRAAMAMEGAPGFDRLRREYPTRRELLGRYWRGETGDPQQLAMLDAMGIRHHGPESA